MSDPGKSGEWAGDVTAYVYDARNGLVDVVLPDAKSDSCEHEEKKRVFRLTEPDGRVTE